MTLNDSHTNHFYLGYRIFNGNGLAAQEDNEAIERLGWTEMTLTEEELTLWEEDASSVLRCYGVGFELCTRPASRVVALITALRKERAAKELAVEALRRFMTIEPLEDDNGTHYTDCNVTQIQDDGSDGKCDCGVQEIYDQGRKVLAKIAEHDGKEK